VLFAPRSDADGVTVLGSTEAGTGLLSRMAESYLLQAPDELEPLLPFDPPTAHAASTRLAVITAERLRIIRLGLSFIQIRSPSHTPS
jgi:hypothetical protein